MKMGTLCSAVALLIAAPALAWAEPIYKSTMPDGRIVYGEEPFPGAQRVDKIASPAASGIVVATPDEKSRATRMAPAPAGGAAVTIIPRSGRAGQ